MNATASPAHAPAGPPPTAGLDLSRIRAISLDLDDTLWPVWPTIERAEQVLADWLAAQAPRTAALLAEPGRRRALRGSVAQAHPELAHDMSGLRRAFLRAALRAGGEPEALAEPAFEVFFEQRQRVTLYPDAVPALRWLSARYPLVAISNGNADVERTGVGSWFRAAFSAHRFGSGKPQAPIFLAAAAALELPPAALLHVGDDLALDVAGAQGAGMQAAWVRREAGEAGGYAVDAGSGAPAAGEPAAPPPRPQLTVPDLQALCRALGSKGDAP